MLIHSSNIVKQVSIVYVKHDPFLDLISTE